ncbi:reverse transcriptase [Ancylostoma ceylanicum]|nr:reverse transcriptase [Ancylostoma ceylanicum]EYC02827.1 hypothetical protein Y032_0097g2960 [Ancylostoma ceylanicum]
MLLFFASHRLVAADVLSLIDHPDWAAPIIVLQKKNESIRLCADYSTGLDDALEQDQHPLPTPDDIFAKLNGGRYFSQLDLAEAYLQLEMDEDSRPLLMTNTLRGFHRLNCLPSGVKPAPSIFQQYIDALIAGLDGTAAYLDVIIVTGRTIDEHNTCLNALLQRIHHHGFRVCLEKCAFLQTEINYLGFVINAKGRRPTQRSRSNPQDATSKGRQPATRPPWSCQHPWNFRQGPAQLSRSVGRSPRKMLFTRGHRSAIFLRSYQGNAHIGSSHKAL